MKVLIFIVFLIVYSNMAVAERFILIYPDGKTKLTDSAPWDLTYPPHGEKLAVLKVGERNEGAPMSGVEYLARIQTAHLIIIGEKVFEKEVGGHPESTAQIYPDVSKMTLGQAAAAKRQYEQGLSPEGRQAYQENRENIRTQMQQQQTQNKLDQIQRTQQEIQNRQRGYGY